MITFSDNDIFCSLSSYKYFSSTKTNLLPVRHATTKLCFLHFHIFILMEKNRKGIHEHQQEIYLLRLHHNYWSFSTKNTEKGVQELQIHLHVEKEFHSASFSLSGSRFCLIMKIISTLIPVSDSFSSTPNFP